MACENISKSRLLGCKSNFSGIKAVSFMPYTKLTLTAGDMFEGTGMTGSVYRYELKMMVTTMKKLVLLIEIQEQLFMMVN
jgi:hypothetical protein